ncbi:hypothetical protein BJ322DRAFT_243880 [Thelephora terrestris]|uniref:Uncharacterized protein n=1 Tax=Thelephora terrestris TaxID=56493 RepID=A0A9P6H8Y5_9AGAM|nr:hypothetical protein BJ322DRAFT_243880 [Thelephora terrestris]
MAPNSISNPSSIFKDGKLKPGIYKIQSLYSQAFIDIHEHSRDVCCRPATLLGEGRGLWEIKPLGAGYSVKRVDPGRPEQFCVLLHGVKDDVHPSLGVTPYPMAWKLAIVGDEQHRGFEYVRFHWETTDVVWDLAGASDKDGTRVNLFRDTPPRPWRIWKLIPVRVENTLSPSQPLSEKLDPGSPPTYDEHEGEPEPSSSTRTQCFKPELEEFGTIVNEVTVVTTTSTVTTRKRYRVEDA